MTYETRRMPGEGVVFAGACFEGENTGPIPGFCGVGGCDLATPLGPALGTSSLGLVARICGVMGGVGSGECPDARFTTDGTAGTVFHGEPDGARGESWRATVLR